jgi:hypothetical protein
MKPHCKRWAIHKPRSRGAKHLTEGPCDDWCRERRGIDARNGEELMPGMARNRESGTNCPHWGSMSFGQGGKGGATGRERRFREHPRVTRIASEVSAITPGLRNPKRVQHAPGKPNFKRDSVCVCVCVCVCVYVCVVFVISLFTVCVREIASEAIARNFKFKAVTVYSSRAKEAEKF